MLLRPNFKINMFLKKMLLLISIKILIKMLLLIPIKTPIRTFDTKKTISKYALDTNKNNKQYSLDTNINKTQNKCF